MREIGWPLQPFGARARVSAPMIATLRLREQILRFGTFELDTATGELRKEGRLIHLRHQPAQVLRLLLEKAGALVTRGEMISALWPDDLDVDVEQGLNHCVKEIRAALGDRAGAPRFIQTFPRRGYRFLAEVRDERPRTLYQPPASETIGTTPPAIVEAARGDLTKEAAPPPGLQDGPKDGQAVAAGDAEVAVRVRVVLSRTDDGAILWSETYDRRIKDTDLLAEDVSSGVRAGLMTALATAAAIEDTVGDDDEDGDDDDLRTDRRFE